MNDQLAALVTQILDLSPTDRVEALRAVLGSGLLPEATVGPDATPPTYKIQGREVDEDAFRFVENTLGIFSTEQLGMTPQRVVEAFETEKSLRWANQNLNAALGARNEFGMPDVQRQLQAELRALGEFVGVHALRPWEVPSASDIKHALVERGFGALNQEDSPLPNIATEIYGVSDHHPEPGGGIFGGDIDEDLDRQLSIAEAAAGVGRAAPSAAQLGFGDGTMEFVMPLVVDGVIGHVEQLMAKGIAPRAAADMMLAVDFDGIIDSMVHRVLESEASQQQKAWLTDVWELVKADKHIKS